MASQSQNQKLVQTLFPEDLKSRFKVIQKLDARGSQAELFLAQVRRTGVRRVVKVYQSTLHSSPVNVSVLRALQDTSDLRLAQLIEFGEVLHPLGDIVLFEVYEYLAAGDLRNWLGPDASSAEGLSLNRRRVLNEPELFDHLVHELGAAINSFHQVRSNPHLAIDGRQPEYLPHRDIKPANFLVADADSVTLKLTDFGIATVQLDDSFETPDAANGAGRVGSERYLPPEADYDHFAHSQQMDWWAMGIIVAELALGEHPIPATAASPGIRRRVLQRDLRIGEIEPERRRRLVEGLLHPSRSQPGRWRWAEVEAWLAGEDVPVAPLPKTDSGPAERFGPSFPFEGRDYTTPEGLMRAMLVDWRESLPNLITPGGQFHADLVAWLRDDIADPLAANILYDDDRTPIARLGQLGALFVPDAPRHRDLELRRDAMVRYLRANAPTELDAATPEREVAEPDTEGTSLIDDVPDLSQLETLFEEHGFRNWANPGNEFARYDHDWHTNVEACEAAGLDRSQVLVPVLSAVIDPVFADNLRVNAEPAAENDDARGQERFADIADSDDPSTAIARSLSLTWLESESAAQTLRERHSDSSEGRLRYRLWRRVSRTPLTSPTVSMFELSTVRTVAGMRVDVRWRCLGADRVHINLFGDVASSGTRSFIAVDTVDVVIVASNDAGGERRQAATLRVDRQPVLRSFRASPRGAVVGGDVTLTWEIEGNSDVAIRGVGNGLELIGSRTVAATQTGSWELTMTNAAGSWRANSNVVQVLPAPPVISRIVPLGAATVNVTQPVVVAPDLRWLSPTALSDRAVREGDRPVHTLEQMVESGDIVAPPPFPPRPRAFIGPRVRALRDGPVGRAVRHNVGFTRAEDTSDGPSPTLTSPNHPQDPNGTSTAQ